MIWSPARATIEGKLISICNVTTPAPGGRPAPETLYQGDDALSPKGRRQNYSVASHDFLQRMTNVGW